MREHQARYWLNTIFSKHHYSIAALSGDASFRRYYRVQYQQESFILMDAPPAHENCQSFLSIGARLARRGIHTPTVYHADLRQGFLLLSDFGEQRYYDAISENNAEHMYHKALALLSTISYTDTSYLPSYDKQLIDEELCLFTDWFCNKHLGMALDTKQCNMFAELNKQLLAVMSEQPQVFVHRDYHSKNLMCHGDGLAVLDYQDAVRGALLYDVASLCKDCYLCWPEQQRMAWLHSWWQATGQDHARQAGRQADFDLCQRWFDWTALQRHLKAIGIFARLNHRDHKPNYLADIPMTLAYIIDTSQRYRELHPLHDFLQKIHL